MGISDDIRPKKYRPVSKKVVKTEIKVAQRKIESRDDGQLFQETHEGDFFADTPLSGRENQNTKKTNTKHKPEAKNHSWIYTLMIVMAVCILAGLVVWQNYPSIKSYIDGSYKKKNSQNLSDIISSSSDSAKNYKSQTTTDTIATTTEQPAAAITPAVDKSQVVISVLNGSGIKNSASSVANTLKEAGFNVKSTANARSFNYTKTFIYYKTDDATIANLVKDALPDRQCEVSKNTSVVGSAYDIVVVVGKQ